MKLGIYSDRHYFFEELTREVRHNSRSLGKIKEAFTHFEREGAYFTYVV